MGYANTEQMLGVLKDLRMGWLFEKAVQKVENKLLDRCRQCTVQ